MLLRLREEKIIVNGKLRSPHNLSALCYRLSDGSVRKRRQIVDVQGADGPSNHNLLCVKGRSGSFDFVDCDARIRYPLIKNKETGEFERATWDEALNLVASKFSEIRNQYGGEALADLPALVLPTKTFTCFRKW